MHDISDIETLAAMTVRTRSVRAGQVIFSPVVWLDDWLDLPTVF